MNLIAISRGNEVLKVVEVPPRFPANQAVWTVLRAQAAERNLTLTPMWSDKVCNVEEFKSFLDEVTNGT